MIDDWMTNSQKTRFRIALILALVADALQIIFLPLFVEGAESPADDALDAGVGIALLALLGWHWEFAPSFLAKLVPGVDLVPFWTLAVANVYRKTKRIEQTTP
ncbi:MAG: hypothetical protein M3Y72_23570 [Acidobacteriota bacterium]|nr:hypothetical protein [Acidobacteriota bacterium]